MRKSLSPTKSMASSTYWRRSAFVADIQTAEDINIFIDGQFLKDSDILHDNANLTFQIVAVRPHFRPKTRTVPLSKASSARMQLMVVVFPEPFGPSRTKISPSSIVRFKVIEGDELLIAFYQIFYSTTGTDITILLV